MAKLYTRGGDDGTTGLYGGGRIDKDALRVETFGTVDELGSVLGLVISAATQDDLCEALTSIQAYLFEVGAYLCTPEGVDQTLSAPLMDDDVTGLEQLIDRFCEPLAPMKTFVLPGGTETAARLHLARCVCRRAERLVVRLGRAETVQPVVVKYLNRLSDLLFAMARYANHVAGVKDVPWHPRSA